MVVSVEKIEKSPHPWVISQLAFFFGPDDNKVSKNEYSSIAVYNCSLALL